MRGWISRYGMNQRTEYVSNSYCCARQSNCSCSCAN
ncbi:hypothetical protein COLO4_02969 [Corchorus olitorius]|uniref:Uncharacterized protein n=1 Tax=Corchorus olitorius TaxID=93759 RepID=A0A1R3KZU4_9ROSI|nr:hypothetical protein COLO4_02969 [Corchorus olitorius]